MDGSDSDMNMNTQPNPPSYKEMIERMKNCQAMLDELQERALNLQVSLADSHFRAAKLFSPEIVEMMMNTDKLLASKNLRIASPSNSKGAEVESNEVIDEKYKELSDKLDNINNEDEKMNED